ncbi:MAG: thioredoxin-dependent thiol peroxidase [Candidatus Pacearchaeota archaeon]
MKLKKNSKAPDFKLENQDGKIKNLKDYKDKILILYFYPKDNTPGCTFEAKNLSENYSRLKRRKMEVVGVSADSKRSHLKFIEKFKIPFDLLADEDTKLSGKYGVWGKKNFMGREYMGILRTTFLIKNGKILEIIDKVDVKKHTEQILEVLKNAK